MSTHGKTKDKLPVRRTSKGCELSRAYQTDCGVHGHKSKGKEATEHFVWISVFYCENTTFITVTR